MKHASIKRHCNSKIARLDVPYVTSTAVLPTKASFVVFRNVGSNDIKINFGELEENHMLIAAGKDSPAIGIHEDQTAYFYETAPTSSTTLECITWG